VHVITRLDLGGAQQNTLFCVRHHDRTCFDVALLAGSGGVLDDEARALEVAHVSIVPYLKHPVSPVSDLQALIRLTAHLRASRPDLVHTHSSKAGILGRLAARLAGVPAVVHTAHGWSFNRTQSDRVRRRNIALERLAASWTDRLIVVSERGRQEGIELEIGHPRQYAVVHSGIDAAEFETPRRSREVARDQLGLTPEQLLVGTVACLKPQKAPLDFVRAAAEAYARCDRLRFVVAGDGEQRDEVEQLIDRLGLRGIVRLLGWRRDVPDLLHAMDVFLLTSRFEGLPRVLLQAMAAGVPVVATAVDGTPEVVRDGRSGLLIPPRDARAAADRVLELIRDPELRARCVDGGRRVLTRGFDIHRMVGDLERIYISLLEGW